MAELILYNSQTLAITDEAVTIHPTAQRYALSNIEQVVLEKKMNGCTMAVGVICVIVGFLSGIPFIMGLCLVMGVIGFFTKGRSVYITNKDGTKVELPTTFSTAKNIYEILNMEVVRASSLNPVSAAMPQAAPQQANTVQQNATPPVSDTNVNTAPQDNKTLDINTADAMAIKALSPLITLLEANKIVNERQRSGYFTDMGNLQHRTGLNPNVAKAIAGKIFFGASAGGAAGGGKRIVDI